MSGTMEKDDRIPFRSAKIGYILVSVFLVLFLGGVLLISFVNPIPKNPGSHGYSYSAIGHHAFVEIAKEAGYNVVSMHHFFHLQGQNRTILFLEPDTDAWQTYTHQGFQYNIKDMIDKGNTVLIACPKWKYLKQSKKNPLWIEKKDILSTDQAESIFFHLGLSVKLVRRGASLSYIQEQWGDGEIRTIATETLQILQGKGLEPLVTTQEGEILIARISYSSGRLILFSDPDIFQNYLIGKEDNGILMLSLLSFLTNDQKTIWIDEISHDLGRPPSIIQELLTYPTVCITLQVLFCFAMIVWMIAVRFRPPLPIPKQNRDLEEQTRAFSNTISAGKKHKYFLKKFIHSVLMELGEFYPSILSLNFRQKVEYLDEIGKNRKSKYSIKKMYIQSQNVSNIRNILNLVKGIHKWKEQIMSYKRSMN